MSVSYSVESLGHGTHTRKDVNSGEKRHRSINRYPGSITPKVIQSSSDVHRHGFLSLSGPGRSHYLMHKHSK